MAEFTTKFRGIVNDESTGNDLYYFDVYIPDEKYFESYFFYLTIDGRLARANKGFNVLSLDEHDEESKAFQKKMLEKGRQMLSELCELAVVKVGIKGALIKRGSDVVHVGSMAAAKRVDTTGAGDLYAAGFLSGLCEGLTLRQCGTIGAIVAGKVIEVVGTTFSEEAWQHAFQLVEKVRSEKYLF